MAGRLGLSKSAAEGTVDAVFEVIAEALAKEEAVPHCRVRHVRDEEPERAHRAESADRGEGLARKRRRSRRARHSGTR